MWVDARSRASFEYFGDVVSFDTTYRTNVYKMPFGAFIGVNHHGSSVLLGCVLICVEDIGTFEWVFTCFAKCMGRAPEGIITDQARAMRVAIKNVWAGTRHRWCIWHIMKKIPDKFGKYTSYKDIKMGLVGAVWKSVTTEEFDRRWLGVMAEFDLGGNEWMKGNCWIHDNTLVGYFVTNQLDTKLQLSWIHVNTVVVLLFNNWI